MGATMMRSLVVGFGDGDGDVDVDVDERGTNVCVV